jgi:hypothetical protein
MHMSQWRKLSQLRSIAFLSSKACFFRAKKIHIEHEQLNRVGKCRKDLSKHVSARMPTARGAMPREPRKNQGKSNRQATDKSKRQQQGIRVWLLAAAVSQVFISYITYVNCEYVMKTAALFWHWGRETMGNLHLSHQADATEIIRKQMGRNSTCNLVSLWAFHEPMPPCSWLFWLCWAFGPLPPHQSEQCAPRSLAQPSWEGIWLLSFCTFMILHGCCWRNMPTAQLSCTLACAVLRW